MSTPLKVGVLLVDTVQLLDLACIDLLYMTTPAYLSACQLPQPLVSLGRPCEIHYIGKQGAGSLHTTTAGLSLILTKSLSDPSVAPGHLDALLIPGPEPAFVPDQADLDFVRAHHEKGTEILSVCTGAYVCGYAGIVDGKSVTGPRALVPSLKRKFPAGKWDDRVRVVRDGRVWSSGGITNGHDLIAEYLRENYPTPLVNAVLAMADVGGRSIAYETPAVGDTGVFLWQVLRALPGYMLKIGKGWLGLVL